MSYGLAWDRSAGTSWRHAASALALIYSGPLASDLVLHANLGHSRDGSVRRRSTGWGLAVEHDGWDGIAPMAELFGDDREPPWWNLGLRWSVLPERWLVDLSYGRQLAGGRPRLLTLGTKLAF